MTNITGQQVHDSSADNSSNGTGALPFDETLYTAAFKLFDPKKIGRIYSSDLIKVFRAAGQNPSTKEINEIFLRNKIHEGTMLPLDLVLKIAKERPGDSLHNIVNAFRKIDKEGTGFITTDELRVMLTSVGEKLSSQEIEEMIEFADKNHEGKVDYEEFAKLIAPRPLSCLQPPTIREPENYF